MPWLPDFGHFLELEDFLRGEIELAVDDPRVGRITDRGVFKDFLYNSAGWLESHNALTDWIATTSTEEREVGEFAIHLSHDGREIVLPIAVAVEHGPASLIVRVYYSQWPLLGKHTVRPPLLPGSVVELKGWPARYHAALSAGDVNAIVDTFEDDGYFREPSGGKYRYEGREALERLFRSFFGAGGGIRLEHCTVTDDGTRCAVEYNALQWGATALTPQAGIAVYERGSSGKLHAARVYDDVEPPPLPTS